MATTAKALALFESLRQSLAVRLSSMTHVVTYDTDYSPILTISADATPAFNEAVMVLKVMPQEWPLAKDVLGNTALQYAPTVIKLCTEESATAGATGLECTTAQLLPVLGECLVKGCKFEWYLSDNGTVPAVAEMTAANLKASFQSLEHPLTSNI